MKLGVIILAAGQGTRMKSSLPKVIHQLAAKPMLKHVVETASVLDPDKIVIVYGHGGDKVRQTLDDSHLLWAEQKQQLGTAHAVKQAMPQLNDMDRVLILYGDVPLIQSDTLQNLVDTDSALALLTINLDNPAGYGRIVRDDANSVVAIVEQKDATPVQLEINEINTGMMAVDRSSLDSWLERVDNNNAQKEYYLTDIVSLAVADKMEVKAVQPADEMEVIGVNDRIQLADLERRYQQANAKKLMVDGVMFADPSRFDLRGKLTVGQDVFIDINVIIEGDVSLEDGVSVGANTVIRNSRIGKGVTILENCVIEEADVGDESKVGPFSRLRPGARLVGDAHIGNFVEIKNSTIELGSKVNHLSYIGDTQMGSKVNIGAGTITCNYDGAYKHTTVIGDNAFVGSNAALVAPVTIHAGATVGAGSVISKDAAENRLTLTRARQVTIENWTRPVKKQNK